MKEWIDAVKQMGKDKYFIIQNSNNLNQYLKPWPQHLSDGSHPIDIPPANNSKAYFFEDGLIGAAGFHEKDARIVADGCIPHGNVIPLDSLTKNKE